MQLEEEYEDKQKVLREKRELESKLSAVSEQVGWGQPGICLTSGTLRWPWRVGILPAWWPGTVPTAAGQSAGL